MNAYGTGTTMTTATTRDNTAATTRVMDTLVDEAFDPATASQLTELGVGAGWRCLHVGTGGGSLTRWLRDRVGASGTVTTVGLGPPFLEAAPSHHRQHCRCDVAADPIPGEGYDVIHTRALLLHLPHRDELLTELVGRLRPGGVISSKKATSTPAQARRP